MKKNILIPTDFSKNSWNAIIYALEIYKNESCNFYLLNAFQVFYFTTDSLVVPEPGEPNYELVKENSEAGLEKIIDGITFRNENPNHKFEMISTYNSVFEAVKHTIQKYDIDLVIMGTKGEGNPVNALYGSNALFIIENVTSCPVIMIPENYIQIQKSKHEVVFATNFKNSFTSKSISNLIALALNIKAAIRILYIEEEEKLSPKQEENKKVLESLFSKISHSFHTLTNVEVASGIQAFIESRNSDLLAIIHKKHGFFQNLFSKSVIKKLGYKPIVPILILRDVKND